MAAAAMVVRRVIPLSLLLLPLYGWIKLHWSLLSSSDSLMTPLDATLDLPRIPKRPQNASSFVPPTHPNDHMSTNLTTTVSSLNQGSNQLDDDSDYRDRSSIDYMACCGLGHRLGRLCNAHWLATQTGLQLRTYWGTCRVSDSDNGDDDNDNNHAPVWDFLFDSQALIVDTNNTNRTRKRHANSIYAKHHAVRLNNDVPGMRKLVRTGGGSETCPCTEEMIAHDAAFYQSIRKHVRNRAAIDAFRQKHFFSNSTATTTTITMVIGLHIRAGNGEQGDFTERGRGIQNETAWLEHLVDRVVEQTTKHVAMKITVFCATDTPSLILPLQTLLAQHSMTLLTWPSRAERPVGTGVWFGERTDDHLPDCLAAWEDALAEMILLSHVDVLVAARPSSFTQSLPLSLVLAADDNNKIYCEVNPQATAMQCFDSYLDWCCHQGRTSFGMAPHQPQYDYIRVPDLAVAMGPDFLDDRIRPRPAEGCRLQPAGSKQVCLPPPPGSIG